MLMKKAARAHAFAPALDPDRRGDRVRGASLRAIRHAQPWRAARPARVVDGDSLEIGGQRIRLFGIDAPEGRQHCRNTQGQDYACGREGAARALDALIGGRSVTCTRLDHDRYEREVAACTVEGRDLGEAMVRSGHARDYARHSHGRYAAAEREAREARRGLWAGEFEDPGEWRKREMPNGGARNGGSSGAAFAAADRSDFPPPSCPGLTRAFTSLTIDHAAR